MKNLRLLPVLLPALLCSAFLSCHYEKPNPGKNGSSSSLSKINILIYHCGFGNYPGKGSLGVNIFIINNSDDTLKYSNTRSLFSKFYCTDNVDMTVADKRPLPFDSVVRVVIPPHNGKYASLDFKVLKMPDTGFVFRIGMKLAQWHAGSPKTILAAIAREKTDTVWSNVKVLDIRKNHQLSDIAEIRYEAQILKKVLPFFSSPLTQEDKTKYTLNINQARIKALKILGDTAMKFFDLPNRKLSKYLYTICEMRINNNSDDTLKYFSMNCSWLEMYTTNDVYFKVPERMCMQNYPEAQVIPPRQTSVVKIPIVAYIKTLLPRKIKIGLSLQRLNDDNPYDLAPGLLDLMLKPQPSNMIWSNEVTIH